MKHFKLTSETKINTFGVKLFRIECTIDCKWAKVGDKGGWVEKESNLSDNAWVSDNALVFGNAQVFGDAQVFGNAQVFGDAQVFGNALVFGDAQVFGDALVSGDADYCCFQSFGSANRTTTVCKQKDGSIKVSCGCFHGSLQEFADKVQATHGDNKHGKEYKAIIEVIKAKFEL